MKTPRLKAFKAWVASPVGVLQPCVRHERWLCSADCATGQRPVRVIVRDARDDSEARLRRENARLRRALRDARDWLDVCGDAQAREAIVKALERRDRR